MSASALANLGHMWGNTRSTATTPRLRGRLWGQGGIIKKIKRKFIDCGITTQASAGSSHILFRSSRGSQVKTSLYLPPLSDCWLNYHLAEGHMIKKKKKKSFGFFLLKFLSDKFTFVCGISGNSASIPGIKMSPLITSNNAIQWLRSWVLSWGKLPNWSSCWCYES